MAATKKRAAIYTRISRDNREGSGLGVERQREDCERLAKSLGVTVTGTYVDNDTSAYSKKPRPAYERLLGDIRAGRVDLVLAWHTDRLHRRTLELERYIQACEPRETETYTVQSGKVDLATASGRMNAKILGGFAQYESEIKSERIQRQKAQASRAGKYLGGRMPYGWHTVAGEIQPEPVAADHVRQGTEALIAGRSLISVTRDWADAGATSLSGTRMNTTQVRRILLRSRNAGLMTFHGEVVNSDQWPAIVPLDKFRKCEAILTSEDRPRQSEAKFKYLLSGIAKCYCGMYVTGFGVNGRRSYRCKIHQEGGRYVPGHASRAMAPLDEYVLTVAAAYLGREDVKAALLAALQRLEDDSQPVGSGDIAALLDRKNALVRLFAQGAISEMQLVEGTRDIETKISTLEHMAAANGGSRAVAGVMLTDDPAAAFMDSPLEVQREVLRDLVSIELQPTGAYRGYFDPDTVEISFGSI